MSFEKLDSIQKDRKIAIENLPDSFVWSDKEVLQAVNQLCEMIQLNNKLINIMGDKIKVLEAKAKK